MFLNRVADLASLRERERQEADRAQTDANVEYLYMLTGNDLPEDETEEDIHGGGEIAAESEV